jgi:hypothetical protein
MLLSLLSKSRSSRSEAGKTIIGQAENLRPNRLRAKKPSDQYGQGAQSGQNDFKIKSAHTPFVGL